MSQTYTVPLDTDTLAVGNGKLGDSLAALRSSFEGAAAPASAVEGQLWYDNVHNYLTAYDGTDFKSVGSMASGYATLLPGTGAPTLANGKNITSVTRVSAGRYQITIPATLPNTDAGGNDYAFVYTVTEATAATIRIYKIISKTATTVDIGIINAGGSLSDGAEAIDFVFTMI